MDLLAYIDPGSGSLFIQAVIATIVVVPFFLRAQIRRGIDAVRGRRPASVTPATDGVARDDTAPPAQP